MDIQQLTAASRTATGNGPARVLRREGKIPAVLYGRGVDTRLLSVNVSDFETAIKNQAINQLLLNLVIDGDEAGARTVMIKELQAEPLSHKFVHIDFYEVSMDRKIRVMVPVTTVGKSEGVEMGGTLQIVRRELEVLCLPGEIPETIEIDVSSLGIGDSIHVMEIPTADNVEIPADVNFTVVTVLSAKVEAVEGEMEEAEEEAEDLVESEGEEEA